MSPNRHQEVIPSESWFHQREQAIMPFLGSTHRAACEPPDQTSVKQTRVDPLSPQELDIRHPKVVRA